MHVPQSMTEYRSEHELEVEIEHRFIICRKHRSEPNYQVFSLGGFGSESFFVGVPDERRKGFCIKKVARLSLYPSRGPSATPQQQNRWLLRPQSHSHDPSSSALVPKHSLFCSFPPSAQESRSVHTSIPLLLPEEDPGPRKLARDVLMPHDPKRKRWTACGVCTACVATDCGALAQHPSTVLITA